MNHYTVVSSTLRLNVVFRGRLYTMIIDQNEWDDSITLIDEETKEELECYNSPLYDDIVQEYYEQKTQIVHLHHK